MLLEGFALKKDGFLRQTKEIDHVSRGHQFALIVGDAPRRHSLQ